LPVRVKQASGRAPASAPWRRDCRIDRNPSFWASFWSVWVELRESSGASVARGAPFRESLWLQSLSTKSSAFGPRPPHPESRTCRLAESSC